MKKQNYDITPGQDKFLPVPDQTQPDYRLLRLHIDDLSVPIRQSFRPPAQDASWRTTASLAVALVILAATIAIVHCSQ